MTPGPPDSVTPAYIYNIRHGQRQCQPRLGFARTCGVSFRVEVPVGDGLCICGPTSRRGMELPHYLDVAV